jgi:hypothetical protein
MEYPTQLLSAQGFFDYERTAPYPFEEPPRFPRPVKTEHPDYMDFAERYADYMVWYEKHN